jgi:hypothetical protein
LLWIYLTPTCDTSRSLVFQKVETHFFIPCCNRRCARNTRQVRGNQQGAINLASSLMIVFANYEGFENPVIPLCKLQAPHSKSHGSRYLDRNSSSLYIHFSDDQNWVLHFRSLGGTITFRDSELVTITQEKNDMCRETVKFNAGFSYIEPANVTIIDFG